MEKKLNKLTLNYETLRNLTPRVSVNSELTPVIRTLPLTFCLCPTVGCA